MAEELALQQVFRDGRAVDRDEGTLGARAELVQRAGEQLLSSSAFADDEDRDVGRRQAGDVAAGPQHIGIRGHHAGPGWLGLTLRQLAVLFPRLEEARGAAAA